MNSSRLYLILIVLSSLLLGCDHSSMIFDINEMKNIQVSEVFNRGIANQERVKQVIQHCQAQQNGCAFAAAQLGNRSVSFYPQGSSSPIRLTNRAVIQFIDPQIIAKNAAGKVDLAATKELWANRSLRDSSYPQDLKIHNINGKLHFPTRVAVPTASGGKKMVKGFFPFSALDSLSKSQLKFMTIAHKPQAASATPLGQNIEDQGGYDAGIGDDNNSETTSPGETTSQAPAPTPDPTPISTPHSSTVEIEDCAVRNYQKVKKNSRGGSDYPATFRKSCWKNLSIEDKVDKVMANILEINQLRPEFYVDPRVGVCMARRESYFMPNIRSNKSTAEGMFQILVGTQQHTMQLHPSVTPGFEDMDHLEYRREMVRSSLAQTDIYHRVMQTKAQRNSHWMTQARSRSESPEVWANIARYYFGAFKPGAKHYRASMRYKKSIQNCYSCLKGVFHPDGRRISQQRSFDNCLEMAGEN